MTKARQILRSTRLIRASKIECAYQNDCRGRRNTRADFRGGNLTNPITARDERGNRIICAPGGAEMIVQSLARNDIPLLAAVDHQRETNVTVNNVCRSRDEIVGHARPLDDRAAILA